MENTDRNYEQEASAQGWKPQDQYSGDPDKWVDAKTFVERGDTYVGIVKDKLTRLERQYKYQSQVVEDLKKQYFRDQQSKQKEIDDLIKQLEKTRKQAITNGDGEAFDRADKELNEAKLRKQEAVVQDQKMTVPTWAQEWADENPWYGQDKAATALAEQIAEEMKVTHPHLGGREKMDLIADQVKAELPERFKNQKKGKRNPDVEVDGNQSNTPPPSGARTYNALPEDAKSEFKRLAREGIFKNNDEGRAKYARYYFEE